MKFKFYQSIQNSFSLKLSLYSGLAYFFILTIYRILFFIYNHNTDEKTNTTEIIKAFLFGIRFDLSTISIIVIFILAISFAGNFKYFFKYQKQLTFIPLIILEWMVLHLGADILYFKNSNKHLGYEAIVFLGKDFTVIFRSALNADLFFILGIFITLIGAGLIFFKGLNTLRTTITSNTNYIQSISHNVLFICILVVLIRGGFQKSPISPGNAAFSKNFFLNNLALNGVFTVLSDLKWKNSPNIQKIKIEEAILIARNEISYPESQFISSRYPILRKTKAKPNTTPPNIVLVILESWTGKFINSKLPDFQSKEITPIFNKLIQKGVYFQNFFSTGGRTSNGLFAILTSIPDRPGFSTIHSQNALANVGGLGNVLKYAGYDSIFIYGGELDFENIKPLVKHWGYDTLYDIDSIQSTHKYEKGIWGYDDENVYDFLIQKLEERDKTKPFLVTVLTLSTHYPYKVPDKKFELFSANSTEKDFLNTLFYADWAIGEFLQKAKNSEYWDNTIFLFAADHTHHRNLNYYEDRNIPLLIYSEKKIQADYRKDFASQLDILPTILGLTGKEIYFSAMGRDLFSSQKKNSGYFAYGNIFGWVEGDVFFLDTVDKTNALHFTSKPPFSEKELCRKMPLPCLIPQRKAKAFLNLSETLIEKNLIFPSANNLKKGDF